MNRYERRARQAVCALSYDFRQFTLTGFTQHLQQQRGRPIIVRGYPFEPGTHACWVRRQAADYILFDAHTHPVHQVHLVLHELAHMVLEHRLQKLDIAALPALVASAGETPTGHSRAWDPLDTPDEHEAEWFVRCVQQEVLLAGRLAALTNPETSIAALNPYTRSLGYRD